MWPDPDGLELQLFQPPAGLVVAAVTSPLPVDGEGIVSPKGVDHVLLQVSNLERSLAYYLSRSTARQRSVRATRTAVCGSNWTVERV
jgi:hypothetical protein